MWIVGKHNNLDCIVLAKFDMAEQSPQEVGGHSTFLSLPVDAISEVCLYLPPNDAINLSRTCSVLNSLIKTLQSVWKVYCKRVWLHTGPCGCDSTWFSEFLRFMDEWGQYKDCYADIREAWDLIYKKLRLVNKNPDLIFRPGASESLLSETEERLGNKLPASYRCLLKIHNGQVESENCYLFCTELFFYHIKDEGSFLFPAENLSQKFGLITLTNYGRLQNYLLCLTESDHSKPGEVKCYSKMNKGQETSIKLHTLSPDFKDWFCRLAHDFSSYPVVDGAILRFPYSPECVVTTRGIRIQVGTAFSNVYSCHIEDSLVIYHITISMSECESSYLTSQLLTRHWSISDEMGAKEPVDGPGVVGYTPVISPGTVFTYTSGSHVEREWSLMEGYFTFENQQTGEMFDAKVPPFKLVVPPYTWIHI